jgi:hypothetical protein
MICLGITLIMLKVQNSLQLEAQIMKAAHDGDAVRKNEL